MLGREEDLFTRLDGLFQGINRFLPTDKSGSTICGNTTTSRSGNIW